MPTWKQHSIYNPLRNKSSLKYNWTSAKSSSFRRVYNIIHAVITYIRVVAIKKQRLASQRAVYFKLALLYIYTFLRHVKLLKKERRRLVCVVLPNGPVNDATDTFWHATSFALCYTTKCLQLSAAREREWEYYSRVFVNILREFLMIFFGCYTNGYILRGNPSISCASDTLAYIYSFIFPLMQRWLIKAHYIRRETRLLITPI